MTLKIRQKIGLWHTLRKDYKMEESQMDFFADYLGESDENEPEPDFSDDYYVDMAKYAEFN